MSYIHIKWQSLVLQDLKKYDEAIQYYDKILAIDPKHIDALNNKANALSRFTKI